MRIIWQGAEVEEIHDLIVLPYIGGLGPYIGRHMSRCDERIPFPVTMGGSRVEI
jgi:hypothetical protein